MQLAVLVMLQSMLLQKPFGKEYATTTILARQYAPPVLYFNFYSEKPFKNEKTNSLYHFNMFWVISNRWRSHGTIG